MFLYVAVGRLAAGSSSGTGQTHERGQQVRRQGHPCGGLSVEGKAENGPIGVGASKLIRLACCMWPVRMLVESDARKRNPAGELSARR